MHIQPTQQDLSDAACWFNSDKVGGPQMTEFKREARWRQHRWAVDELSVATFGTHAGRRTHPDIPAEDINNGTKLLDTDAEAGGNFLTPGIYEIAKARVADKQEHETLDATRLFRDLLSSMPMAFNLFGEASLPENAGVRQNLAAFFGVPAETPCDIVFEWSPGRRSQKYTRDRTAFDVALRVGDETSPRTVVGIETKYHEHSAKEKKPSASKFEALKRYEEQTDFLVAIAEESEVFDRGWKQKVLNTDLRQIWRDHLLALSMRPHPEEWTTHSRYALLYPSRNVSFHAAAIAYSKLLIDGDTSFQAFTIDELFDAAFPPGSTTKSDFRRRYLWWADAA